MLVGELEGVGIGLCGLSKLHWLHAGECDIIIPSSVRGHQGEGDWKLVWSRAEQRCE